MQYLAIMAMLDCKANLSEKIEYLILCEVLEDASLCLLLMLVFDLCLQVSIVCIVHDYTQLAFLCLVYFSEANNVRVAQHFQDLSLSECFFALLITQLLDVNLLDNSKFTV